jgi:hypothetical protein
MVCLTLFVQGERRHCFVESISLPRLLSVRLVSEKSGVFFLALICDYPLTRSSPKRSRQGHVVGT